MYQADAELPLWLANDRIAREHHEVELAALLRPAREREADAPAARRPRGDRLRRTARGRVGIDGEAAERWPRAALASLRPDTPRPALTSSAGLVAFPVSKGDPGRPRGRSSPDHPGLPARVSVLRLPARGRWRGCSRLGMRPRCSPGPGPWEPRPCVRTLEPGSGVDPSSEQTSVASNATPEGTLGGSTGLARRTISTIRAPRSWLRSRRRRGSIDCPTPIHRQRRRRRSCCPRSRSRSSSASRSTSRSPSRRPSPGLGSCAAGWATSTPRRIAATDPAELDRVFRERPAIHRFPGSMAGKVAALCARDRGRLRRRRVAHLARGEGRATTSRRDCSGLPGIGEMKARTILAVLGKRFGVSLPGMADVMPTHPTLGDVDSPEALASYQAGKRAHKAELRAQGKRV